jgi:AraC-like DNA-binding protein
VEQSSNKKGTLCLGTSDPDEFTDFVQPFAPLVRGESNARWEFKVNIGAALTGRVGFVRLNISHGRVTRPGGGGYAALTIPIEGRFQIRVGGKYELFTPGMAHVLDPHEMFDSNIIQKCRVLGINIDDKTLEQTWLALTDGMAQPCRFPATVSMRNPSGRLLFEQAMLIWSELERGSQVIMSPRISHEAEGFLTALYVNLLSDIDQDKAAAADTSAVYRVVDYIHAHLEDEVTLADLVSVAAVSERALTRSFRRRMGTSPMCYMKQQRMKSAQKMLLEANATVTEVAVQFGFFHLGRFAVDYKAMFGESPSTTLRCRRC